MSIRHPQIFKDLGVAKPYFSVDSIGDTVVSKNTNELKTGAPAAWSRSRTAPSCAKT